MVTRDTIIQITQLAQITLSAAEQASAADKINQVIKLIDQINIADTEGVAPMSHPFAGMSQPLREDIVTESDNHEALQAHAPSVSAGLYLVPAVLEGTDDAS